MWMIDFLRIPLLIFSRESHWRRDRVTLHVPVFVLDETLRSIFKPS